MNIINEFINENIIIFIGALIGAITSLTIIINIQYHNIKKLLKREELLRDLEIKSYARVWAKNIYNTTDLLMLTNEEIEKIMNYARQEYEESLRREGLIK